MKHSLKILLIELGLFIASFFCIFVVKINYFIYLGILSAVSLGLFFLLKPDLRKERFYTEILLIIIISILFYFAITYLLGFLWGVYYTSFSKTAVGRLVNVCSTVVLVLAIENIRSIFIKNSAYHKEIVYILPLVCAFLEIPSMISNIRMYTTASDLLNIFLNLLLPCIVKNITLTYIVYKADFRCSIVYQLLFLIPNYFVPFFPNLGDFFYIVFNVIFPIIVLMLVVNVTITKDGKITNSRNLLTKNTLSNIGIICMISFILVVLYLTSNMFRFTAFAIGSESMSRSINKGDMVIIDKKPKAIQEMDVIAFKEQGRIIVHRVISVEKKGNTMVYQTKGDANPTPDNWKVYDSAVVGKVKMKISMIGWITVKLSEVIQ